MLPGVDALLDGPADGVSLGLVNWKTSELFMFGFDASLRALSGCEYEFGFTFLLSEAVGVRWLGWSKAAAFQDGADREGWP